MQTAQSLVLAQQVADLHSAAGRDQLAVRFRLREKAAAGCFRVAGVPQNNSRPNGAGEGKNV